MNAYAKTDVGRKRSMNQDYFYCGKDAVGSFQNLFIVDIRLGTMRPGFAWSR